MTPSVTGARHRGRETGDACPGALRTHTAADGELVRIRIPGGEVTPGQLRTLAAAATASGDGRVGLTSRGNLQLRAIAPDDVRRLVDLIRGSGLLPAADHERVRNIVASPLSGRGVAGEHDVDRLVRELDRALCARPGLALLPGRFLFAVDDGSHDVVGEQADVLAVPLRHDVWAVRPAGASASLRVGRRRVVEAMLAVAEAFLAEAAGGEPDRPEAWRIAELPDGGDRLLSRLRAQRWPIGGADRGGPERGVGGVNPEHLGPGLIEQTDGRFAVCALAPLGLLDVEQARALAAVAEMAGDEQVRVTPWRRVVVRDLELPAALAGRELIAAVDLVTHPASAWNRVTACTGRPGCAKALADVRADATAFVATAAASGPAVHWAGCARGCGTPAGAGVIRMTATTAGYLSEAGR